MARAKEMTAAARRKAERAFEAIAAAPIAKKLQRDKVTYVAAVYWGPGDYDKRAMVRELKKMRKTGINAVRYHTHLPEEVAPGEYDFSRSDDWFDAAAEADLKLISTLPHRVSPGLLALHGVDPAEFERNHLADKASREALRAALAPFVERYRKHPALFIWHAFGEPKGGRGGLDNDYDRRQFVRWLKRRYKTVEALDAAWNMYPEKGRPIVASFDEVMRLTESLEDRGGQAEALVQGGPFGKRNYGANRDMLLYIAEKAVERSRAFGEIVHELDPDHPVMTGHHQLMGNQAYFRWHVPKWARTLDTFGTSIHLSWHFETVRGEVDRPVFMQARMTRDLFKGGLTSAYETTGGAVQYSGGYPNGMSAGLMRRLVCSYLAAGNQSMAFWTWNHRPGCWEVGEYGLSTLSGRVTPWAEVCGAAAKAMERYGAELWDADNETRVALLTSWDTDAIYIQEPERHDLLQEPVSRAFSGTKMQGVWSRVGAARAFVNRRTAFEYLSEDEVMEGLAARYPVIYAPHVRAVPVEVIKALEAYVRAGGRLIADVQFGLLDPWGKMHPAGEGGPVERLFGAWADVIQHTRTNPIAYGESSIDGFYGDLVTTDARVLSRFSDGRPAITERTLGRGSAVLVGFDAGRMCRDAGREDIEALIADLVWADEPRGWESDAPLAWRRRAPKADHYFLATDGPARTALIRAFDAEYRRGELVLDGTEIDVGGIVSVEIPAESAVWVRLERK